MTVEREDHEIDSPFQLTTHAAAREIADLREALSGLSKEIRSQHRRALDPKSYATGGAEWNSLFDELRRRVGTLGMVERHPEVDDFGMQVDFVERLAPLFDFLYERYWRVDLIGVEHLTCASPVVFIANRSGVIPWDGMMLSHAIDRCSAPFERPRFLIEDNVLRLPFAQAQFARVGGVRSCRENLDQLLSRGHSVIAFPEAIRGVLHSFRERYQVGDFDAANAIRAAIEAGAALVPVGIVGAEDAYPRLGDMAMLSKLMSRDLRIPSLPITPTFPLLGPLGLLPLPAKWVIAIGNPIFPDALATEPKADESVVSQLNASLRSEVQRLVEHGLDSRSSTFV